MVYRKVAYITRDGAEYADEYDARVHELMQAIMSANGQKCDNAMGEMFFGPETARHLAKHLLQSFQITVNELTDTKTIPMNFKGDK